MATLIEKAVGNLDDKRRWRAHRARVRAMAPAYRTAVEAIERYASYLGALTTGDLPAAPFLAMVDDLADRFERAAADAVPVREVVSGDAAAFAQSLVAAHLGGVWVADDAASGSTAVERQVHEQVARGIDKERARLVGAIARAAWR